jgi:hypothetical protein
MEKKSQGKITIKVIPPKHGFMPPAAARPPLPEKQPDRVSGADVANALTGLARGWSKNIESALWIPKELYHRRDSASGSEFYSQEPSFGIIDFVQNLRGMGAARPATGYGIAMYETAGSQYFVFVDMKRRIAFRGVLQSYHEPGKRSWDEILSGIKSAEQAAAANPGKVAFHDGSITLL